MRDLVASPDFDRFFADPAGAFPVAVLPSRAAAKAGTGPVAVLPEATVAAADDAPLLTLAVFRALPDLQAGPLLVLQDTTETLAIAYPAEGGAWRVIHAAVGEHKLHVSGVRETRDLEAMLARPGVRVLLDRRG